MPPLINPPALGFPKNNSKFLAEDGNVSRPWYQFLRDLSIASGAIFGLNVPEAIPSGVPTVVLWHNASWDIGGWTGPSHPTYLLVPRGPFKIRVKAGMQIAGTTTAFALDILLNGVKTAQGLPSFSGPGGVDPAVTIEGSIIVKAQDQISLRVTATGAGLMMAQYQTFLASEVISTGSRS